MNDLVKKITDGMSWKAWLQLVSLMVIFAVISGGADHETGEGAKHVAGHVGMGGLWSIGSFILGRLFK